MISGEGYTIPLWCGSEKFSELKFQSGFAA